MAKLSKTIKMIPSPFPVVTEYEEKFERAWYENHALAIKDVLKYVKNASKQQNKKDDDVQQ